MSATHSDTEERIAIEALQRIAADLTMITDRVLSIDTPTIERARTRPAGRGRVHLSFKLGIQRGAEIAHGSFLVPLPEAIALAGYLMMLPDDAVLARRDSTTLDASSKDALLEIGNFVAGACEAALRSLAIVDVKVRSEGCQGVHADVRPAFRYVEGAELVVARAPARLAESAPFEAILIWP